MISDDLVQAYQTWRAVLRPRRVAPGWGVKRARIPDFRRRLLLDVCLRTDSGAPPHEMMQHDRAHANPCTAGR